MNPFDLILQPLAYEFFVRALIASALVGVACAVVGAFVVLKGPRPSGEEAKKIAKELRDWVAKEIGPIAKPKDIRFGDNLPKTRSGKLLRRAIQALAEGRDPGDLTTIEDPTALQQIKDLVS